MKLFIFLSGGMKLFIIESGCMYYRAIQSL